jgi:hypothetical protein
VTRKLLVLAASLVLLPLAWSHASASGPATITVDPNGDFHTIQAAVDAAQPGDTVLISAGTYQEEVSVETPGITVMGVDRESVILDGAGILGNAFTVTADGVTLQSMTAQNYASNGFVFTRVDGCHWNDLHAKDNAEYGLYGVHSRHCLMENSIGEGHGDSGFYLGETVDCDCDVQNNVGWNNMLGYSGTANSHIRIHGNDFYGNRAGILLSVLPTEMGIDVCPSPTGEAPAPGDTCPGVTPYGIQTRTEIYENHIHDNNVHTRASGIYSTIHPPVSEGIVVSGGWNNDIHDNLIENNHLWGVGLFWLTTPERGNYVHDNTITGSRYGVWWDEQGEDNCFENNDISSVQQVSDPAVLPSCAPLVPGAPQGCPSAGIIDVAGIVTVNTDVGDWAACRGSDVRAPSAYKDAGLALRSYYDLQPDEDPLP